MSIQDWYKKIVKGVRAGIMTIQQHDLRDVQITSLITEWFASDERKLMLTGEQYYEVDNDILERKIAKTINNVEIEETYKANNRLAHAKYKNLVDEKVTYLLSADYALDCPDNEEYSQKLREELGKHFSYKLMGLGYEASNKGIGWLQTYIDEQGAFQTMIIPAEQCIPIWSDASHTKLNAMIRVYNVTKWDKDGKKKVLTYVEHWTPEDVTTGQLNNGRFFIPDTDGAKGHFVRTGINGDVYESWGRVPFVPFKNNRKELPDIKFIKTLVDNYDITRSDAANYLEEVKNLIFVLKGYGGEDIADFMAKINLYRAIIIDDPEHGGVDTLNPSVDIAALKDHYDQLKKDIVEDGQGLNHDLSRFSSAPSGVTLSFLFRGLDLKCNALEVEFKMGFEQLLYFVNRYWEITGEPTFEDVPIDIIFNREAEIDESEVIDNCEKSHGVISKRTVLLNHPWVDDVDSELEQIKQEEEDDEDPKYEHKVPIGNDDGQEQQ